MAPEKPSKTLRMVQVGVLIGLAALLWIAADGQNALALLRQADPLWLVAAIATLTLQTVLSAQRWRITAARLGLTILPAEAIKEYYLAQIVNQTLPGGFVGDAGRAVRARHQAGLFVSGQAVVFERVTGQLGLLAVLGMGLTLYLALPTGITWPDWVHSLMLLLLIALVGVPTLGTCLLIGLGRVAEPVRRFFKAFRSAVAHTTVLPQQIGLSLGTAICNLAAFAFCAQSVGVSLPLLVVATVVPLILFTMLIPLSVSGWGMREGAAAVLFPVFGATASQGLATSVAFGLVFLATVVPGLFMIWRQPAASALRPH